MKMRKKTTNTKATTETKTATKIGKIGSRVLDEIGLAARRQRRGGDGSRWREEEEPGRKRR